jgi:UPF0755 protein
MAGDRTPEERERARLEREARRAAKRGDAPPPEPVPVQPPPAATPPPEPPPAAEPRPAEPPSEADPGPADAPAEPVQDPVPAEPVAQEPFEPELVEDEHFEEPEPVATEARPPEPPAPFDPDDSPRRPPAVPQRGGRSAAERRKAAKQYLRGGAGGVGAGRGGGDHGGGRKPRAGGPDGRSRKPRVAIVAVVGGLIVVAVAWFLLSLFQPMKGDGAGDVAITVPSGASVGEIGDLLESKGVISSAFFFRLRTSMAGKSGDFKAGEIPMREDMSYAAAIDVLADPPQPETVTITIPEGLSRSEAKELIGDQLRGDYEKATVRSKRLSPADYGGRRAKDLEGFLFPATYELKPGQPVGALVDRQLAALKQNLDQVDLRYAKSKNLTPYDVLTIASMIDREAQLPKERALVASVIYNRLSQGIPLGIDATIRFATGNWSEPLKQSELAIDSGYNTRTNQGLPPGPIGNPGLAAMKAAAKPAKTDFIYYVVKPCGNGAHAFSETDAEFQADVERYNAERERQGGNSPTEC